VNRPTLLTEHEALAKAAKAFAAKPAYAVYTALMEHYDGCFGCAYATAPCAEGTRLRQEWKVVRLS
jgi:hypothetical protein